MIRCHCSPPLSLGKATVSAQCFLSPPQACSWLTHGIWWPGSRVYLTWSSPFLAWSNSLHQPLLLDKWMARCWRRQALGLGICFIGWTCQPIGYLVCATVAGRKTFDSGASAHASRAQSGGFTHAGSCLGAEERGEALHMTERAKPPNQLSSLEKARRLTQGLSPKVHLFSRKVNPETAVRKVYTI